MKMVHDRGCPAPIRARWAGCLVALVLVLVGCAGTASDPASRGQAGGGDADDRIRLYTSYSQPEVDALVKSYGAARPGSKVEVFRAPTGQLAARIAAEERSGGVRGDVLLLSDPLSMQQYAAAGKLLRWTPPEVSVVPPEARTDTAWGVTTSNVVVVHRPGDAPASWRDLTAPRYRGKVALPDPSFAGSAFGALGYFSSAPGYGLDFYRALKANGAVQVQSPGDVITGVAEGRFDAGMTLDFLARAAVAKGSPLELSAPDPGAVRLFAPVAVFAQSANAATAKDFAGFLLTRPAQEALAELDRQPIRADVPAKSAPLPSVVPDWPRIFRQQAKLQADYRAIFGG